MTPDVSVIVAVFNTMPLLNDTLACLERQTIGLDNMQIVLIDDGSSDGSSAAIQRFAQRHPDRVVTHRQENSGTPAAPFNRGLERATGRYVFFLGADDYLSDDALEAAVTAADDWESDVVAIKTIGLAGRSVNQRLFNLGTAREVDPFDSPLPYNLANSKLFRRALVEDLGLRYREDIRSHCDQPFTFVAIMHARRISVLAEHPYYFVMNQENSGNVTLTTSPEHVLESAAAILSTMAAELEPGARRDYYVRRQFEWDVVKLLNPSLLDLARDQQEAIANGVQALCRDYLTDAILAALNVRERLRLALAREGRFALLLEVVESIRRFKTKNDKVPFVLDGERIIACYPGFDTASVRPEWYEVHGELLVGRLARGLETTAVSRQGADVVVDCTIAVSGLAAADVWAGLYVVAEVDEVPAATANNAKANALTTVVPVSSAAAADAVRTDLRIRLEGRVLATVPSASLRLRLRIGSRTYDLPVPANQLSATVRRGRWWRRAHLHVRPNNAGFLVVTPDPGGSPVGRN